MTKSGGERLVGKGRFSRLHEMWSTLCGHVALRGEGGIVPETRAGYFVSSQNNPPFETDLSSQEISDVFSLLRADQQRWGQFAARADGSANGHPDQAPVSSRNGHTGQSC
jgi:hypothetical protein